MRDFLDFLKTIGIFIKYLLLFGTLWDGERMNQKTRPWILIVNILLVIAVFGGLLTFVIIPYYNSTTSTFLPAAIPTEEPVCSNFYPTTDSRIITNGTNHYFCIDCGDDDSPIVWEEHEYGCLDCPKAEPSITTETANPSVPPAVASPLPVSKTPES